MIWILAARIFHKTPAMKSWKIIVTKKKIEGFCENAETNLESNYEPNLIETKLEVKEIILNDDYKFINKNEDKTYVLPSKQIKTFDNFNNFMKKKNSLNVKTISKLCLEDNLEFFFFLFFRCGQF